MNTLERIRLEIRHSLTLRYTARIRRELSITPDDPDLRWALRELEAALALPNPPEQSSHPIRRMSGRPASTPSAGSFRHY